MGEAEKGWKRRNGVAWHALTLLMCWMLLSAFQPIGAQDLVSSEDSLIPVRVGVLSTRGKRHCLKKWDATADYLTAQIQGYSFSIVPLSFDKLEEAIKRREVEFFLANPSFYVSMEKLYGAMRIATLRNLHSDGSVHDRFAGVIFYRTKRNDINGFEDLRQKTFMAVSERSFSGWQMVWREFNDCDIDPYRDFMEMRFGGRHEAVVYAVRNGDVDAGTVRSDTLERMLAEGSIKAGEFRVLEADREHECEYRNRRLSFAHSTRSYPEWPFAETSHADRTLAREVALALIGMPANIKAAQDAQCAGWTIPQNYQSVHECLRELKLSPYEEYGKVGFSGIFFRYWQWLVGVPMMLALILLLGIRILHREVQVKHSELLQNKAASERLMPAIEQIDEAVVITDADAKIQYVNPAFEKISGYKRDEVIGENPRILKSDEQDELFYDKMWDTISRGETWRGQLVNRRKDEVLYTEDVSISPVRDISGKIVNYVAVKRDITEELVLDEQHKKSQKMEAVGRLAGGVAHDFNNILQTITGFCGLIISEMNEKNKYMSDVLEIQKAALYAGELTQQLLSFSRETPTEYGVVNLNTILTDGEKMLRQALDKSFDLKFKLDPDLKFVNADVSQILQIVMNLIVNARDATPNGGEISVFTRNRRILKAYIPASSNSRPGEWVSMSVADSGCGMTEEQIKHLFEPFYTTKSVGKGTGLGLSVVYGIVEKHGGWIDVSSKSGEGSIFQVCLPIYNAEQRNGFPGGGGASDGKVPGCRVLLLEFDPVLRGLITEILRDVGYVVSTVANSQRAKTLFARQKKAFDVLLLNMALPDGSGVELAEELLEQKPELAVLLISKHSDDDPVVRRLKEKGFSHMCKPFNLTSLLNAVGLAITHRKGQKREGWM